MPYIEQILLFIQYNVANGAHTRGSRGSSVVTDLSTA